MITINNLSLFRLPYDNWLFFVDNQFEGILYDHSKYEAIHTLLFDILFSRKLLTDIDYDRSY